MKNQTTRSCTSQNAPLFLLNRLPCTNFHQGSFSHILHVMHKISSGQSQSDVQPNSRSTPADSPVDTLLHNDKSNIKYSI